MEAAIRWSPHSTGGRERFLLVDVVDQSLSLNQITKRTRKHVEHHKVARLDNLPNFGALDWSKTEESIVALGLPSGSACLVRLDSEESQRSEIIATFKLKQQRKCNSIALSSRNWLAVALDKTRSDNCLNIFDASGDHDTPIRRLCPAEVVSSVRFFPSQPQELIVAAQRSVIRLYDLRDAYLGNSNNTQVSTRNVNNITIDPLDENYFVSSGSSDEPSLTVWDRRWIGSTGTGAVFDFRPVVDNSSRTTIWSSRFSGSKRGRLAVCSSRGELKVIDMVSSDDSLLQNSDYLPANPHGGTPWSCNRYVAHTRVVQRPSVEKQDNIGVKSNLLAFDWVIDNEAVEEQCVLAVRPNRKIDILTIPSTVLQADITPRNDIFMAFADLSIAETRPRAELTKPQAPYENQRTAEDFGPSEYRGEEGHDLDDEKLICSASSPQLAAVLSSSTLQRERCRQGYLWNSQKNAEIVSGNWQLERLWEIIERFRVQAANGDMIGDNLDLSFVGVTGICSEKIGNVSRRAVSPAIPKVEGAISALNQTRDLPPFEGARTDFPDHRQLSLELCGWKFTVEALEEECNELIDRGLHYQAIVQAVLHGYKHIALNILRSLIRSKTVPNIGLGALLASDKINEEQREMCLWMAADTEDPALKALLTYLTTGDWRDIMKTQYLHLGYRVSLGLKYLNDTEVKGFLQSETARAVKNGDLEGILLTGLGEQAMDLLQTYLAKTNDLQTAVLATAYTNPTYVDDCRWEMWKETYFMQMQSWRAFAERASFVVQHNQMSKGQYGRGLVDAAKSQVVLRCGHCQKSLARHDGQTVVAARSVGQGLTRGNPAGNAGVVCPQCGRHMPRCGICKLWLGTPDPRKRGGAQELQRLGDVMAKFITFCVVCQHGFHAEHARSWFEEHKTCPVPDCSCSCTVR